MNILHYDLDTIDRFIYAMTELHLTQPVDNVFNLVDKEGHTIVSEIYRDSLGLKDICNVVRYSSLEEYFNRDAEFVVISNMDEGLF